MTLLLLLLIAHAGLVPLGMILLKNFGAQVTVDNVSQAVTRSNYPPQSAAERKDSQGNRKPSAFFLKPKHERNPFK